MISVWMYMACVCACANSGPWWLLASFRFYSGGYWEATKEKRKDGSGRLIAADTNEIKRRMLPPTRVVSLWWMQSSDETIASSIQKDISSTLRFKLCLGLRRRIVSKRTPLANYLPKMTRHALFNPVFKRKFVSWNLFRGDVRTCLAFTRRSSFPYVIVPSAMFILPSGRPTDLGKKYKQK